jgi:hypothetical protein
MAQYVWGLYFEHGFDAGRFVLFALGTGIAVATLSLVVVVYRWKSEGDLVGSSNIGSYILALAVIPITAALSAAFI